MDLIKFFTRNLLPFQSSVQVSSNWTPIKIEDVQAENLFNLTPPSKMASDKEIKFVKHTQDIYQDFFACFGEDDHWVLSIWQSWILYSILKLDVSMFDPPLNFEERVERYVPVEALPRFVFRSKGVSKGAQQVLRNYGTGKKGWQIETDWLRFN